MGHLLLYIFRKDMIKIMYSLKPKQILRFWSYVKKVPNGCWEWQGCLSKNGYGRFQVHPKTLRAHRVSYFLFNGSIPKDKIVCHTCDNTKCLNPEHLWLGSTKENIHDMINKGRVIRSRKKHRDHCSSKYSGVYFRKDSGKWKTSIMRNYKVVWRGQFDTEEEAHQARLTELKNSN